MGAASHRSLQRAARFLRSVIPFNRRGTGLSDPVTVTHAPDLDTRMSDIGAVMDAARSDRAVLFGMSEGGRLPPSLRRCILSAPRHWCSTEPWLVRRRAMTIRGSGPSRTSPRRARVAHAIVGPGCRHRHIRTFTSGRPRLVAWYGRLERAGISPGMIASVAAMFYDTDVRAVLPTISTPTLVLHRRGDRLVNVRSGRYLGEHIPAATYVELDGINHCPSSRTPSRSWTRSRSSSPAPACRPSRIGAWRRCCSPTSSAPRNGRPTLVTPMARTSRTSPRAIRAQLARGAGIEVKTLGDGFLATFDGPARRSAAPPRSTELPRGRSPGTDRTALWRDRGHRRRHRRHRRTHCGPDRSARRLRRGPRESHGEGPGRRFGNLVRVTRHPRPERHPRRVGAPRSRRLFVGDVEGTTRHERGLSSK